MKPNEVLTTQQRDDVLQRSDVKAWVAVMSAWTLTLITLMLVGHFPGFLTLALAWVVLPGRQLSLAVLMHEAGHGSLFKTRALNRWVGEWLCALPVLSDFDAYARGHQIHHRLAGTADDPDLPNYHAYPISKASLTRKWFRDLTGQTGFKVLQTLARGTASQMSRETPTSNRLVFRQMMVHGVFIGVLALFGIAWTWFVWAFTFLTSYMWVVRLRQVGEHAVVPDLYDPDVRANTRTVEAPRWQRFLVAPNNVNYHLEHHFMAGVPCYNLPKLRSLLKGQGLLDNVPSVTGYGQVLKMAVLR
ncbi:MAG: fatty acid desaturase family protein [Luminiphilus sp.]|nr:fatty acid desaturase family protein [Luminiphilus sp.]